jgi:translation initiation factor 3 subunit G
MTDNITKYYDNKNLKFVCSPPDENGYYTQSEYKLDPITKDYKFTHKSVVRLYKAPVKIYYRAVERQKNWVKFGAAAISNEGVTTLSSELIFMESPFKTKIKDEDETKKMDLITEEDKSLCKKCGGDHWTRVCPGNRTEKEKSESKKDKSEVKEIKHDFEPNVTIQVSNLDKNTNEFDLYDLFSPLGPIKFVSIAKDFKTKVSRGFGFVMFKNSSDAASSIERYNNHGYKHLLLKVSLVNHK